MNEQVTRARLERFAAMAAELKRRENREQQSRRGGLIEFVRYFWRVLEPVADLVDGWPLEAICAHLEAVTFGEINRLLVNVPPGFMKSLLTDVFWPAWEWGPMEMPHLRYVAFSYSAGLTERDNGKFRDLVMSREYQELWGGAFQLRKIGETKVTNDKTGSKLATSVGGIGTGERGDRAICDDLHNIKESESEAVRTETVRWFREALSNRLNDLSRSAIVVIMQRVHESDVSGTILDDFDSYTHLMIPMEYESDRHCETEIGWSDPRTEDGELAWPERFPAKDVEDIKRAVGPFAYASQYQQRPAPREGGIIKPDWWRVWDKEIALRYGLDWNDERPGGRKEYPPFSIVIASLDAAYTKDKANDYSALTLWGLWNDRNGNRRLMMSYAWHDRLELHDLVRRVAETCKKHQVDRLLIEAKASGISVGQEIRRLYGAETFGVELLNPGNLDKVARAHSIVPLFAEGVIWAPITTWSSEVIDECCTFPKGAHDDYVDSATQAIRWLRDQGLAERSQEREFAEHEAMSDFRQRPAIYDV